MRGKFKILWGLALTIWFLLSIFGVPLNWESAMQWLTDIDIWIINYAVYPGILTLWLVALVITIGVTQGGKIAQSIEDFVRSKIGWRPAADMSIREAFDYITERTKWKYQQNPRVSHMGFYIAAANDFRQRALLGQLNVWGKLPIAGSPVDPHFSTAESEVPMDHWKMCELDVHAILQPDWRVRAHTIPEDPAKHASEGFVRFSCLRVNKRQIKRGDWRTANILDRLISKLRGAMWRAGNT